jgi:transcriptional regulator with XRE-family HTH domain
MAQTTEDLAQLGRQLKGMREAAHISVAQMAVNIDKTVRTIENWESGRNNPGKVGIMAYEHFTRKRLRDQPKSDSLWGSHYGLQDPLPFDVSDGKRLIDLRDKEPVTEDFLHPSGLYALAG